MVTIELRVSDPTALMSLRRFLEGDRDLRGLVVVQQVGTPTEGELGAWDFLRVAAASGGELTAAVRIILVFIRSYRTDVTVRIKLEDREIEVSAANAENVVGLVDEALNG
jgi:hypothetical protein